MSEQPFALQGPRTTYNYSSNTWSGANVEPLYHPNTSLGQVLINSLRNNPNSIGQISHEDGNEMKNWEILRDSIRVALNLRARHFREGDVLGFAAGNSRSVLAVAFGSFLNGIPLHTLDPILGLQDITQMYRITKPKIVICDDVNYDHVKEALRMLGNPAPIYVVDDYFDDKTRREWISVSELLKEHPDEREFVSAPKISNAAKLPALVVCSSGTTGFPKVIPVTHSSLLYANQDPILAPLNSRMFCFSSFYWVSGVAQTIISTLNNITRVCVRQPFSVPLFLEIVKTHRIGMFTCPPSQLQQIQLENVDQEDLQSLFAITCVGTIFPQSLVQKFNAKIIDRYALSEGGAVAIGGFLFNGVSLKIVDDAGDSLDVGDRGEICMRPRIPFLGYYGDNEASKFILDEDGFLHTGDIGIMDENGKLHVVDRKKDIFKFNNYHVSPADVERDLDAMEGIGLVNVVGIPNEIYGSLPAAVIVRKTGSQISELDVHKFAKTHLSHYKWLRGGVYFMDEMPMTVSGKILRREVTKIATALYNKNQNIAFNY